MKNIIETLMNSDSGMAVLVILIVILLLLLVMTFSYQGNGRTGQTSENRSQSIDNTIAQIEKKQQEELLTDSELVAVIAAAIAASQNIPMDGFVVRSIKRAKNNNWRRA